MICPDLIVASLIDTVHHQKIITKKLKLFASFYQSKGTEVAYILNKSNERSALLEALPSYLYFWPMTF